MTTTHTSHTPEELQQNPDPAQLFEALKTLETDQKKWNYLRDIFLEEADLDEFLLQLDTDEVIGLSGNQLTNLKVTLEGYRVYLKEYLQKTGERIGRFDAKLKQSAEDLANPDLTPEAVDKIAHTRKRVAKAMQIAQKPRGTKGKSLREAVKNSEKLEDKTEADYAEFVDGLKLMAEQKEKLIRVVAGYEEAVATARELDSKVQIPSKEQVIAHILALGTEKLEKIATILSKPGLTIEPDKSFTEMKDAMNKNRHYNGPNKAEFDPDYEWSGKPGKVSVSIMDMIQYPAVVPGQRPGEQRNGEQLRVCEKYFRDNGMQLASDRQFSAGLQKSLRADEQAKNKGEANPEKHILDFYGRPNETVTIFNQEHNSKISKVAYGNFDTELRRVNFNWDNPDRHDTYLRGRGAVPVM